MLRLHLSGETVLFTTVKPHWAPLTYHMCVVILIDIHVIGNGSMILCIFYHAIKNEMHLMMFSIENVKTILTFMSMHLGFASLYDAIYTLP